MTSKTDKILKIHPFALMFPQMTDEEISALAKDIRKNGLVHPILMFEGKILDGRNRYLACQKAGIKPKTENFTGTRTEAFERVISLNFTRRHLTTPQKAVLALQILEEEQKLAKKRMQAGKNPPQNFVEGQADNARLGEANEIAGEKAGISKETVRQANKIKEKAPDVLDAMKSGQIKSMPEAQKLSKLPQKQRDEILRLMKAHGLRVQEALNIKESSASKQRKKSRKGTQSKSEKSKAADAKDVFTLFDYFRIALSKSTMPSGERRELRQKVLKFLREELPDPQKKTKKKQEEDEPSFLDTLY